MGKMITSVPYSNPTDIQYVVNKLSQFLNAPDSCHWTTKKKLLRYLAGSMNLRITLNKIRDFDMGCLKLPNSCYWAHPMSRVSTKVRLDGLSSGLSLKLKLDKLVKGFLIIK